MTIDDMKKTHMDKLKCGTNFEEYQEHIKKVLDDVKEIIVHSNDWQNAWTEWLKLYGKEFAEKRGVYNPKEDEIEVIPVPDEESDIWTVHINVRKKKAIEIVQVDFIIKEPDTNEREDRNE